MTKSLKEIDVLIREALGQADAEMLDELEDLSLSEQMMETFRGSHRRLNAVGLVVMTVFVALSVYFAVRFLGTNDVPEMIRWGAGFFFASAAVLAIKVWYWLEMGTIAIRREIKRLELQVARLGHTLLESPPHGRGAGGAEVG